MESSIRRGRLAALVGVLALCAMLLLGTRTAYAEDVTGNGWTLDDNGVLTLTENIETADTYGWAQYASRIYEVRVAEGVTEIPRMAFASSGDVQYGNLQKVTTSSTVRIIGASAFGGNPSLTEVHLNDGLERVENVAFSGAGFTEIDLPENVEWSSDVFINCDNLVSVTISSGSTWGGGNAQFYGCDSLETVYVEEGVTQIPSTFLNGCNNLEYVWIPKSVTEILGTPILNGCIIGYTGTAAEEYAQWRQDIGVNVVGFHAIDGDSHEGTWNVVAEPTCTTAGQERLTCDICGAVQTREIAATGHSWGAGVVTAEPTATAEGVRAYTCAKCGATRTEAIPALGVEEEQPQADEPQAEDPQTDEPKDEAEGQVSALPQTGDSTLALVALPVLSLLLLSAGALALSAKSARRVGSMRDGKGTR